MLALVEVFFTPLHSVVTLCILSLLSLLLSLFFLSLSSSSSLSSFSHAHLPLARVLSLFFLSHSSSSSLSSFSHAHLPLARVLSLFFLSHSSSSCHSKALPTRLRPRVLCVHPSAPITPSPVVQCALSRLGKDRLHGHLLLKEPRASPVLEIRRTRAPATPARSRTFSPRA